MLSWYSMSIMIPVPVVIYGVVLFGCVVTLFLTSKNMWRVTRAMLVEAHEFRVLTQRLKSNGSLLTDEGGKDSSTPSRPETGS